MPVVMPKDDVTTISNLEHKKLLSKPHEIQDFPPTPRTILGNGNLPKAPLF
jgi:hypothetical protein